jgi:hypothetical protein
MLKILLLHFYTLNLPIIMPGGSGNYFDLIASTIAFVDASDTSLLFVSLRRVAIILLIICSA